MATLTIRNLNESVHAFLRQCAASHGRSMEAEVRDILQRTMEQQQSNPGEIARRIHARFEEMGGVDDLAIADREPAAQPPSLLVTRNTKHFLHCGVELDNPFESSA